MRHDRRLGRASGNAVGNPFDESRCCPHRGLQTRPPGVPAALHRLGSTQRHDSTQRQVEGLRPGGVHISDSAIRDRPTADGGTPALINTRLTMLSVAAGQGVAAAKTGISGPTSMRRTVTGAAVADTTVQ
jgi:hypothetical protein